MSGIAGEGRRRLGLANGELAGLVSAPRRPTLLVRIYPHNFIRSAP
jgi:hypothetical protein